ncbi:MAG: hypothetical protein QG552_2994, partial [Thermodesulfobacteriota bacterium]|nr:hypothetical protein [Thermodesulfobacteriota bacterium]
MRESGSGGSGFAKTFFNISLTVSGSKGFSLGVVGEGFFSSFMAGPPRRNRINPVDVDGLEPTTCTLQTCRSPNCELHPQRHEIG